MTRVQAPRGVTLGIEEKYEEVRQLISIGRHRGYLVYDEVNDILPKEISRSVEEIEELYDRGPEDRAGNDFAGDSDRRGGGQPPAGLHRGSRGRLSGRGHHQHQPQGANPGAPEDAHAARGDSRQDAFRPRRWVGAHTRGSRPVLRPHPRANPANRIQGTAEVASPIALEAVAGFPRGLGRLSRRKISTETESRSQPRCAEEMRGDVVAREADWGQRLGGSRGGSQAALRFVANTPLATGVRKEAYPTAQGNSCRWLGVSRCGKRFETFGRHRDGEIVFCLAAKLKLANGLRLLKSLCEHISGLRHPNNLRGEFSD